MSKSLQQLSVPERVRFERLAPPPRFATATLRSYHPQHPSQTDARAAVADFVDALGQPAGFRWPWQRPPSGRGLYLDGGFGVGKTHLLAAAYHAFQEAHGGANDGGDDDGDERGGGAAGERPVAVYLSFQELVYAIGVLGREGAQRELGRFQLYCIDEFELDDPGNTLLVKTFLTPVFARGGHVVTTSNTPPEAQGRGRFNADDFTREIQSIAERFETVAVGGPDYRHRDRLGRLLSEGELRTRLASERKLPGAQVLAEWRDLLSFLEGVHPIRYRGVLAQIGCLYLTDVRPIERQNDALRFVHFIDKLYDMRVGLRAAGEIALDELFHDSYRHGAYAKKHERCLSRLSELLEEPVPTPA